MRAKKKPYFAWQLAIRLSFERRKIFRETVLQILLICLFSCSSAVTPRRRCFKTCSVGVVSKFRFEESSCFWYFCLVAVNMHLVLVGFNAIRFLRHHPEISFSLCCKSLRVLSTLSLDVFRVPLSANVKDTSATSSANSSKKNFCHALNKLNPEGTLFPYGCGQLVNEEGEQ